MAAWRDRAACRVEDPDLWFPDGQGAAYVPQIEKAKAICNGCPVRPECLRFAVTFPVPCGILGGLDEQERRVLRRRDRRRVQPQYVGRAS